MHWQCEAHPFQPLQLLCLSPKCENNQALCFLCKQEMHSDHEPVLSLRLYIDAFLSVNTPPQNWASQTAQIDQQLIRIRQRLVKLKNKFFDFAIVEEAFRLFWREITEQILKFNKTVEDLAFITVSGTSQTVRELNLWIKKCSNLYYFEKNEENCSLFSHLLKEKYVALKAIAESIDQLREKPTFDDFQVLGLFRVKETRRTKFRLYFSEELKGECMTIQNPTKASVTKSGNQRMILLEPALSNSRSIKKWRVKISKLASWIGVGIAHLDSIKTVNFEFSYTSPNHGNYLISSNGYSWNGYKMEYNSKLQPFTFLTGDIVEISYDPPGSKITFSKEGGENSFTYEVDPEQKPLHAAINMTGIGDAVEILQ